MLKILLERKSLMFWCFVRNMNHLKTRVIYLGKKCWRKLTLGHYQFQRTLASPRKGQALFWCQHRLTRTPIAFMVANIIKHATVPIWHMTTMNALHFKILPLPMKEDIHCVLFICVILFYGDTSKVFILERETSRSIDSRYISSPSICNVHYVLNLNLSLTDLSIRRTLIR